MSVNKVILVGNLGRDPELKHTNSGKAVATLSLATNEEWTDKQGEKQKKTEWHRVIVWEKTAENCAKYLEKGRQVYIEGKLRTREWEKDGEKRFTTEVQAERVVFLSGGGEKKKEGTTAAGAKGGGGAPPPPDDDDIPF